MLGSKFSRTMANPRKFGAALAHSGRVLGRSFSKANSIGSKLLDSPVANAIAGAAGISPGALNTARLANQALGSAGAAISKPGERTISALFHDAQKARGR